MKKSRESRPNVKVLLTLIITVWDTVNYFHIHEQFKKEYYLERMFVRNNLKETT